MPSNISKNSRTFPLISLLIPTLNSQKVLSACLDSIRLQTITDYEILIIDGGSTDQTLEIAQKYKSKIFKNPLKTAEAAKAIGLKQARGIFVALIDSDNILPDKYWLKKMLSPFQPHPYLIGSEPWSYTYRPWSGFIERYSALTGVNDPYALIAGNFDRKSFLNNQWTNLKIPIQDFPTYQIATLYPDTLLPTIGANGTIFRRSFLQKFFKGNYFFDIDIITSALNQSSKPLLFAKVKTDITHTFCESSILKFSLKQKRRATDLYIYRKFRSYPLTQKNLKQNLLFTLYVILILPMFWDTVRGFIKKPDLAWFFHPLACLITLYHYGISTIKNYLGILTPINRSIWKQ
jgi:glycosyltransferase involved in cell wall biosynthesis